MFSLTEILYGFPCKKVKFIRLLGPEGKTSTAKLIQHILSHLNIGCNIYYPKYNLSKFAAKQIKQNIQYIISEYSHPLIQKSISATVKLDLDPSKIAEKIKITEKSLSFDYKNIHFITDSPYYYLVNAITVAFDVCSKIGVSTADFLKSIEYFPEILGQREEVNNKLKFRTFLDSARTPLSLNATLCSFSKLPHKKLYTIFGYSSLLDKSSKTEIGKILLKYSDKIFFTSDDTIHEPIEKIASELFSDNFQKVTVIPNRQDAFNEAIRLANTFDFIIALGRGRKNYLIQNNTRFPWSEAEAFRTAFRIRNQ
jgi:UDP-N-acetylmuramyl tripeptide synthase